MSSEIAIKVENVSKCYIIYDKPQDRLKQSIVSRIEHLRGRVPSNFFRKFWAVQNVSLEVKRGETVGIIGRNGSGKSTLLQLICGTLAPTEGRIQANGRISALLELGSGFNPDFTGRENAYVTGALYGLSKAEIDSRINDIISFADIGSFFDQAVKTYSSGMYTRLGFSVAVAVRPEILIIDEALAVGDVFFQQKCFARIREIQTYGTTILFVSHDPSSVKLLCDRSILLDGGKIISEGDSNLVVNDYIRNLSTSAEKTKGEGNALSASDTPRADAGTEYRYGDKRAFIRHYELRVNGHKTDVVALNGSLEILLTIEFTATCLSPVAAFYIKDKRGIEMYSANTYYLQTPIGRRTAGEIVELSFVQDMSLAPGDYTLSFGVSEYLNGVSTPMDRRYDCSSFAVVADRQIIGVVDLRSTISIQNRTRND